MRHAIGAAAAALLFAATVVPTSAANVTVMRGPSPTRAAGGQVTIVRGAHPMPVAAAPDEARRDVSAVAGGSLLWLIDSEGQVKACGVRGAGRVGAPDIVHCSAGPVVR